MSIVAIQHAADTGRFYPAYYLEAPLPGLPEPGKPRRFRSKAHHARGFDTLDAATENADRLAAEPVVAAAKPDDGWPIVEVDVAGPSLVFVGTYGAVAL